MAKALAPTSTLSESTEEQAESLESELEAGKDAKCDNHPSRKAYTFTGNGAFEIHLCDECTPSWFKTD